VAAAANLGETTDVLRSVDAYGRRRHNDLRRTEGQMETYVILRRDGWRTPDELRQAAERSTVEGDRAAEEIRWIRSYVLAETDGGLGTVCIYQASSPETIRRHAFAARLPVDEIVNVADTVIVRPDPTQATPVSKEAS
jgi:Protein of unknown function (DUF4242)